MLDAIDRKRRAKMPSNTLAEMGSNWWYERASGIWDHTTQIVFLAFVGVPLLARHFKRLPQIKMSMVAVTGQNGAVEPEALVCVCVCVCVCASVCATLGMRFRRLRARVLKQFFSSTLAKHVRDGQAFGVE